MTATQMDQQPPSRAAAPEAPGCAPHARVIRWFDNLENTGSGKWAISPTGGKGPWYYPASHNLYNNSPMVYAVSGRLFAVPFDPDRPRHR